MALKGLTLHKRQFQLLHVRVCVTFRVCQDFVCISKCLRTKIESVNIALSTGLGQEIVKRT